MHQEEVTLQSLTENEDIQIGYSDNDIIIMDSIQKFAEVSAAHLQMNTIAICSQGKAKGQINGRDLELCKNQVAVIPPNVIITDMMVSPDLELRAIFLTNRILQSFLREKMSIWNDMMYIQREHIISINDDAIDFYTHFYHMLRLMIERRNENPYQTESVQSLLRSAILGLCGNFKLMMPSKEDELGTITADVHFQHFLDLLNNATTSHRTVDSYANDLCITPKYLSSICKKKSGKTASTWIKEHLIEEIRYYLKQTDLSIKQISDRLGFPNASFFGKYVKEHFGMTPIQFRNLTL